MKKLYTLCLCSIFAFVANAQNYDVTLAVDMNSVSTVDTVVSVAGNFQSVDAYLTGVGDWSPGEHKLTDGDGNGVYRLTINVPAGTYLYKYVNGSSWGNNEGGGLMACGVDDNNGGYNREMTISSDTTLAFIYDSCMETTLPLNTQNLQATTTFKVAPNPFTNSAILTIDNAKSNTHNVILTNIAGGVVRTLNSVQGNRIVLERGNLVSGIYFVTLINEKGERGTRKLVIR